MTDALTRPRPIDHLVLPTEDLNTARARLTALGFTVAPNGIHPFGTENCCVYFADGTFLEPLAIGSVEKADKAVNDGNVFVARDRLYRERNGAEGFSALVFGTSDAKSDHARFAEAGISAGDMLAFSRQFIDATGKADTASFLLAFAAKENSPDAFFFTCERVNAPAVDRSALQKHENGVIRIAQVMLSADNPSGSSPFFSDLAVGRVAEGISGIEIEPGNGTIAVLDPGALERELAIGAGKEPGLRLQAIIFQTVDLAAVEGLCKTRGIACDKRGGRLLVPPAPGQGAHFAFEAIA